MKTTLIIVSAMAIALLGGILIGYHRGYSQGSRDELSRWKVLSIDAAYPNGTITGQRELWVYSDGTRVPAPRRIALSAGRHTVNSIPAGVFQ
jgi:hypothetical protein